jgi:hypothetical protein
MERIKSILAVAPFVALAVAVTYLHGYWGYFGILAFPYLNFQELIAYSAAPIFGFLLSVAVGAFLGALNALSSTREPRSRRLELLQDAFTLVVAAALVYQEIPFRWLFAPMAVIGVFLPPLFRSESLQKLKEAYPALPATTVIATIMLIGSFGYGRSLAEQLQKSTGFNARITWDTGALEEVKLIGRLGSHYFYLDNSKLVNLRAEQYVKRIQYLKAK